MSDLSLSADGEAVALACAALAPRAQSGAKPLNAAEWHELSKRIVESPLAGPRELLGLTVRELQENLGIESGYAERLATLLARGGQLAFEVDRLAERGVWLLTRADGAYPMQLKRALGRGAPPVLYGSGSQDLLRLPGFAIVGSRHADDEALRFARELARRCAAEGVAVVSGAARGVDLEAMGAAIEAGGPTIGVTADPLERLVRRPTLRTPIGEGALALITPFHPAARWQVGNAMGRNKIVYTLAAAAAVVATTAGSGGTWTGAVENLKHGWVPLFVRASADPGGRALEQAGATALGIEELTGLSVRGLLGHTADPPHEHRQAALHDTDQAALHDTDQAALHDTDQAAPTGENGGGLDSFDVVWPLLANYLRSPRSDRDVAEALSLQLGQARAWLDRAVAEQRVTVRKRPRKVYIAVHSAEGQLELV